MDRAGRQLLTERHRPQDLTAAGLTPLLSISSVLSVFFVAKMYRLPSRAFGAFALKVFSLQNGNVRPGSVASIACRN